MPAISVLSYGEQDIKKADISEGQGETVNMKSFFKNKGIWCALASILLYALSTVLAYRRSMTFSSLAGGAGICAFLFAVAGIFAGLRTKRNRFSRGVDSLVAAMLCLCISFLLLRTMISGF